MGIFQMEPATHADIWRNWLRYQPETAEKLRQLEQRRLEQRIARREEWLAARDQADMKRTAEKLRERLALNRSSKIGTS